MSEGLHVLYVCTGNVCRSAAAQQMLRTRTAGVSGVVVTSAGTGALEGHGVDAPTAAALAEVGVSADGHVARWLEPEMLERADVILTATTEHRDRVHRQAPRTMRRAFTMREFVRLGADVPGAASPGEAVGTIREVAGQRGLVDPPQPGQDEIGDPFGAGLEAARLMVAQVGATIDETIRLLGLARAG